MKWFGNDSDGMTTKDFTVVASLFTTFGLVTVGAIKELFFDGVTMNFIDLVKTIVPVAVTAVGGVFGLQAVQTYKGKDDNHESYK